MLSFWDSVDQCTDCLCDVQRSLWCPVPLRAVATSLMASWQEARWSSTRLPHHHLRVCTLLQPQHHPAAIITTVTLSHLAHLQQQVDLDVPGGSSPRENSTCCVWAASMDFSARNVSCVCQWKQQQSVLCTKPVPLRQQENRMEIDRTVR